MAYETRGQWYGIRVRSKYERLAASALEGKGYDTFLPLYSSRRVWSDRSKVLELPLFAGYLFCRFDLREPLLPILTTPGVMYIVGAGNSPIAIPEREIEQVRIVANSALQAQPWQDVVFGTKVLIERGPLAGVEGLTVRVNKGYRLVVSISLLQRSVAVEIDSGWIRESAAPLTSPLFYNSHDGGDTRKLA